MNIIAKVSVKLQEDGVFIKLSESKDVMFMSDECGLDDLVRRMKENLRNKTKKEYHDYELILKPVKKEKKLILKDMYECIKPLDPFIASDGVLKDMI